MTTHAALVSILTELGWDVAAWLAIVAALALGVYARSVWQRATQDRQAADRSTPDLQQFEQQRFRGGRADDSTGGLINPPAHTIRSLRPRSMQ